MTELRGITWNHTRGFVPLVATAQRFSELNPDMEIRWEKRSLQAFADSPVDKLAERYDLLVIDHPVSGYVSRTGALVPLDEYLPREFLLDQSANSTGESHSSYEYAGHQWALAIDAAAPVCGYRPDLLKRAGATLPSTWPELVELARRGLVVMPGIGIDSSDELLHALRRCRRGAVCLPRSHHWGRCGIGGAADAEEHSGSVR